MEVAGQFYPIDPKALRTMVSELFAAAPDKKAGEIVALLVPHAALEYSGGTAARAYKLLKPGRFDSVILVGSGHYKAVEGAAIYPGSYAGGEERLPYDEALAKDLGAASPLITFEAAAHAKEHSIEVQLPLLAKRLGKVKLVAMTMNTQDLEAARAVGTAIARAVRGRKVLVVASSDLSHYPEGKVADAVDATTLEALASLDPSFFWATNRFLMHRKLPALEVTWCGEGAVTAVLTAARELGAGKAVLLGRLNSGDVVSEREYNHVVGYAAMAFTKEGKPPERLIRLEPEEKKQLLAAARQAIKDALEGTGKSWGLSKVPRFNLPAAVFVTLRGRKGELRGCIGSMTPQESLLEAVAKNAVLSATADARFKPISKGEFGKVHIDISVLSPMRAVSGQDEVKPGDGVTLEKGGRSGVFLPQVWGDIPDKDAFLAELCSQKAGLPPDCYKDSGTRIRTFSVDEFAERN